MANNSSLFPSPSHGNLVAPPAKPLPTNGDQVLGSMPNLAGNNQINKNFGHSGDVANLNNNPNGYSAPSIYNPSLQTSQFNHVYNHSSSQSSRNSSPAMNQPMSMQPSPQAYPYKTSLQAPGQQAFVQQPLQQQPVIQQPQQQQQPLVQQPQQQQQPLQQNSTIPQQSFVANVSRPLLPPTSATGFMSQGYNQNIRPTPPLLSNQPMMYPAGNVNQIKNNTSQYTSPPNATTNNNQLSSNTVSPNMMQPASIPNRQINLSTAPLLSSQNPINPPYPSQLGSSIPTQNVPPPSIPLINKINSSPQSSQTPSHPAQGNYPPQGNLVMQQPQVSGLPPSNMQQSIPQANVGQQYRAGTFPQLSQPMKQGQYYNGQPDLSHQMDKLSVSHDSFGRLWRQETVDLLQCRHVLTEDKEAPPTVKLSNHFSESTNCSSDIFRCTLTKIPESNNLLQKSRLPLGILIHPFKDLNHLPVIQCNSIVRCRSCRTYINPFVYFVDLRRWKCNLCYRVNDLPEEFQYDPVSKTYGEPRRRPEILSATIEYIAPSEYMLRPPQPAAYCFVIDVSAEAARAGYLSLFCSTLAQHLSEIPGDTRTMLSFICFDQAVHFYSLRSGKPNQMTVMDIDDIFVPSPEDLLVNLAEKKSVIEELLEALPGLHASPCPSATQSALGAALLAAHKLMAPTGGRITVFQACLPNIGPGALVAREDPNNRSSKDVAHLNPATDFYKRLALDCSGVQVAVDLFLMNSQYSDLSTLNGMSQFSGGTVYHFPLFKGDKENQAQDFQRCLTRYITRKIGFEAVMRVRCTRGISIHTFHGSFFVRSTDLLALPNVSPDAGFGMQLSIEESLADVQQVCFQAALLYTSSKGERRIRVHTLCLPVVNTLNDVIHSADQQAIIGLLCKMGVDRSLSSSLTDAREALLNAAVDALGTQRLTSGLSPGLISPMSLRLLPLYILGLFKHPAFRTGTSTRLDDRIAAMCMMKTMPLSSLMRCIYPDLYPVHNLIQHTEPSPSDSEIVVPSPPRYHLTAERVNANGAYLLDQEMHMILYVGHRVNLEWLQNVLGVGHPSLVPPEGWWSLPVLETKENALLHTFINQLNDDKPYAAALRIMVDTSPNRGLFVDKLLDDRTESAMSYHEFLQHIKSQIK